MTRSSPAPRSAVWVMRYLTSASGRSAVQVDPFAVQPEQRDRLNGPVDNAEPVRGPCRKFNGLTGFDGEVLVVQNQPEPAGQHIHPVLAFVHRQFGRWCPPAGADPNL